MVSGAVTTPSMPRPAPALQHTEPRDALTWGSGVPRYGAGTMTLADGAYDALVVDAEDRGGGTVAVELTIVAGTAKGEVVTLVAADWTGDPLDLLGVPATLTVRDGEPSVRFEP